jgi:hypothetical protein
MAAAQDCPLCGNTASAPYSLETRMNTGARSRDRTGTPLRARDFKSRVSTSFTIRAAREILTYPETLLDCP